MFKSKICPSANNPRYCRKFADRYLNTLTPESNDFFLDPATLCKGRVLCNRRLSSLSTWERLLRKRLM